MSSERENGLGGVPFLPVVNQVPRGEDFDGVIFGDYGRGKSLFNPVLLEGSGEGNKGIIKGTWFGGCGLAVRQQRPDVLDPYLHEIRFCEIELGTRGLGGDRGKDGGINE